MTNTRKNNLILGGTILVVLVGFFWLIFSGSSYSEAIAELDVCTNHAEVKAVYDKHRTALKNDNEFDQAVRNKLDAFNLAQQEIDVCVQWLPPKDEFINVIVLPDLSNRIYDTLNNPDQTRRDRDILREIWKCFERYTEKKPHSKDRLILQITNTDLANGPSAGIAKKLVTDLKEIDPTKTNKDYYGGRYRRDVFYSSVGSLYADASKQNYVPNFFEFFSIRLYDLLKKNTLYESYHNKLIILTDGYIDGKEPGKGTLIEPFKADSVDLANSQAITQYMYDNNLRLNKPGVELYNTEVLICEMNARKDHAFEMPILKAYWHDWFVQLNVPKENIQCLHRDPALKPTISTITDFITNLSSLIPNAHN